MVGKSLKSLVVSLLVIGFVSSSAYAQDTPPPAAEQKTHAGGPRKQLATIIFAGLGGAVLGLSTLSFYGRPQDHLVNLPIGFGVGIIAGTIFTTYHAVSQPSDLYGESNDPRGAAEYALEHTNAHGLLSSARPLGFNYDWEF